MIPFSELPYCAYSCFYIKLYLRHFWPLGPMILFHLTEVILLILLIFITHYSIKSFYRHPIKVATLSLLSLTVKYNSSFVIHSISILPKLFQLISIFGLQAPLYSFQLFLYIFIYHLFVIFLFLAQTIESFIKIVQNWNLFSENLSNKYLSVYLLLYF